MADDQKYNAEEKDDLELAVILLEGKHSWDSDHIPTKEYLAGHMDFVARKALVRLLRINKPVDSKLRRLLAALFDPETEVAPFSSFDSTPIERRLDFGARHRGSRTQSLQQFQLANEFERLVREGTSRDDALKKIAKKYSVSTRWVEAAAKRLRDLLGR